MEKLNAQFSGEFKQFSLKQAAARLPFWRTTGIFSANDISRMQVTSGTLLLSDRISAPPLMEVYIRTSRVLVKDLVKA